MSTDVHRQQGRPALLRVCGLSKRYFVRKAPWHKRVLIPAAVNISFEIPEGKTLGLVGGSGSGKSTVARCVARLEKPDAGEIWLAGRDIAGLDSQELRAVRRDIQMIFQDPATSMNPRMSPAQIIEEPLTVQNRETRRDRRNRAAELMQQVGLSPDWLDRRITEFSGGQRQRIAIARALVLQPRVLVLDEALTGLDIATQAQIVDLLLELQKKHSINYLLISHDLNLVTRIAERVAVISAGMIVEEGTTSQVLSNPAHSETQALVLAATRFRTALAKAHGASA